MDKRFPHCLHDPMFPHILYGFPHVRVQTKLNTNLNATLALKHAQNVMRCFQMLCAFPHVTHRAQLVPVDSTFNVNFPGYLILQE